MNYVQVCLSQTYENQDDPLDYYFCSQECADVFINDIKRNYPEDDIESVSRVSNEEEFNMLCDNCGKKINY